MTNVMTNFLHIFSYILIHRNKCEFSNNITYAALPYQVREIIISYAGFTRHSCCSTVRHSAILACVSPERMLATRQNQTDKSIKINIFH
jgi:hypothetical protein